MTVATRAILALVLSGTCFATSTSQVFELDVSRSVVIVEVGKAGAFSFIAGHTHRIRGPVRGTLSFDPEHPERAVAAFEIRTSDLTVTGEGEPPEDVPKVQQTMSGENVLNVGRYPAITFQSTAFDVRQRRENVLDLSVTGNLMLHGATRSIIVPVRAEIAPGMLTARGTFVVKQTDYNMTPVSAAGGTVTVKDALTIHLTIVAQRTAEPFPGR